MASYLRRPQQQSRSYGNMPAPFVPGGGATMAPPMPAAPRTTGRAATGGAMPYVPPPVVTNPNISPFQLSLNSQRADEATKAKNFASAAPLPMSGGSYSGAYGEGPGAQRQAEAARSNFIGHNESIIDRQDLGPGIGVRSFSNKLDTDYAAAHPYVSPMDQAKIGAINAWSDNVPGSQANKNNAGAALNTAQAGQTTALTQPKTNALNAGAESARDRGKAALTKADADAAKIRDKGNAFNKDTYNAGVKGAAASAAEMVAPHKMKLAAIFSQQQRLQSDLGKAIDATQQGQIQRQLDALDKQETAARKAYHEASEQAGQMRQEATNPDRYVPPAAGAQGGQGAEPGASAAPAGGQQVGEHVNPATGQRANWDGSKWVIT